jgi:hypothetical protein
MHSSPLPRATALALAVGLAALGCSSPTQPSGPEFVVKPIRIASVDIRFHGAPPQAVAQVSGVFASACAEVNSLRQTRTGNTITVTVLDQDPKGFCIAIPKGYRADIVLQGAFPLGDYLVSVNGVAKAFTINPFTLQ